MFRWYVINTYSGHENKVKNNLEHRVETMEARARVRQVVVPTEQIAELKDGQRVQWPDSRQVGQGTAVTLGFTVLAGGYLGLLDAIWKPLVNAII